MVQKEKMEKDFIIFKKVGEIDKYNFFEYVSVLLDGGIGITEALESVSSKIKSSYFRHKIYEIIAFISSGDSFSKSMKKVPDIFSMSEISVIEAGETTGKLGESLREVSDSIKKSYNLKNKIKSALTYPTIIFLFLIVGIIIVMAYVIPSIKSLFEDAGTDLPIITKALIGTSDFVYNNLALIFLVFITVIVIFLFYVSTDSGKIKIESIIIGIPLFGRVYKNYILANSASTLGNLVGSGISIVKSLQLSGKASGSLTYRNLFEEISEKVSVGEKIVLAMEGVDENSNYFPADYLQMLSAGEKIATLEEICVKLSNQYEKEVDYSLENMVKWIEPLAILLAGIFVMWFVFAIFGAITQITQSI